ncbi:c-13 antigen, putative [Plasmodium yoelii yoelii]|uniref:C-13 antigen, putative n=1 Tax=Plasmodium yoelii yoelii TaxID=73239 RepID=Q7REB1_PLAYO|nr:c-13 antigen, putative [Plasmodium yoelii yoelii]
MKREKKTKKSIKYIRDQIKEIELESKIINKHIKKLEEERKIFKLSTVLLEKYSSFISTKLANNLSIHIFNNTFLNSCGILFTNYPHNEIYYNNLSSYPQYDNYTIKQISSNYVYNENVNTENVNTENVNTENVKYSNIFRVNSKKGKYEVENMKTASNKLDDKINNQTKRTHSCHNIYIKNYKKTKDTLKNKNNVFKIKRESFHSYFKDPINMLFEENQFKNLNNNYIITNNKLIESENYISSDAEINTNIAILNKKNSMKNYNKLKLMQMETQKEKKTYMGQINLNLKDSINFSTSSNDEYNAHSYIKSQSQSQSKNEEKNEEKKQDKSSSTFGGFMNNVKKFFFNDQKNILSYKNSESDLINELEFEKQHRNEKKIQKNEKKTDMSILKFQCVIKSKRTKIYLCVCPNCTKQFYLLIKKIPNKKIISKVFPPFLFSSFVENLRKNNEDLFYQNDKHKWEQLSNMENQFNTYHDNTSSFNSTDSNSKFCNCYIGFRERDNNIF